MIDMFRVRDTVAAIVSQALANFGRANQTIIRDSITVQATLIKLNQAAIEVSLSHDDCRYTLRREWHTEWERDLADIAAETADDFVQLLLGERVA